MMETRPYLLHALSPLHAGTGQAADVIDLPIARMRSTGIPIVPGSSVKGVLRDARRDGLSEDEWKAVFGPDNTNAGEHAGALIVGDARLLALPVRSFRGTFAWVTCPLLLSLAKRDLGELCPHEVPQVQDSAQARVALVVAGSVVRHSDKKVYLEDLDLAAQENGGIEGWANWLAGLVWSDQPNALRDRWVVVSDETMTFLWETATQIDTRVRIQEDTRTVARGALWTEESLPPETILLGLMVGEYSRRSECRLQPAEVLNRALAGREVVQFGGKATVGRGRCRIIPVVGNGGDQ